MGKPMDQASRKELEDFFEQYIQAIEDRDAETLISLWRESDEDRAITIFGIYDGIDSIRNDLYQDSFLNEVQSAHVTRSESEILDQGEGRVLLYGAYHAAVLREGKNTLERRDFIVTMDLHKEADGWKIAVLHQSVVPLANMQDPQQKQEKLLDLMLEIVHSKEMLAKTRGSRDRRTQLQQAFRQIHPDLITNDLMNLESEYLSLERKDSALTAFPFIMSEEDHMAVWTGEPNRLAADALISFIGPDQSYDEALSRSAGLLLKKENAEQMQDLPAVGDSGIHGKVWMVNGTHLPVKSVIVIAMDPVYGLYTRQKSQVFSWLIDQALKMAKEAGYKNLAILPGWRSRLNVPVLTGANILTTQVEQQILDPDSPLKQAVLIPDRNDMRKTLLTKIDELKKAEAIFAESDKQEETVQKAEGENELPEHPAV